MSGLVARIEETAGSGVFVAMSARAENVTGSPLFSCTVNDDGRAIADTYELAFTNIVVGVSATVTVSCGAPNNPYDGAAFAVLLDGSTSYSDIVPGVDLVFA